MSLEVLAILIFAGLMVIGALSLGIAMFLEHRWLKAKKEEKC